MFDDLEKQTNTMVKGVLKYLEAQEKSKGIEVAHRLMINFLASFIGSQVYMVLKDRPKNIKTDKQMVDYCTKAFLELKIEIQNCVAAGFQGAMQEYTGKNIEYYCQIKTVPEVVNKQPC